MSTNVIVTGLPGDSKFPKLVYSFKGIFKRIQIKKFWIRELVDNYDSDFKQMTVEFVNSAEARKARNYLNNLPYAQGQGNYMLMATLDDESMAPVEYHQEERDWGRNRRPAKRARARSRSPSPRYAREANKLDMEIELLRKQRQVIEEERRLLLEQKKLEMIREFGPSASMDFDRFEPPRKRQQPAPEPVEVKPKRKRSPLPQLNAPRIASRGLPQFFQPCKKLISDMKEFIYTDTTPEEVEILIKLIRAAIRKNLAIALDGKDYMPTGEIMRLYRELHPKTTDAAFVAKILSNIRASYLPDKIQVKKEKQPGVNVGGSEEKTKISVNEPDAKVANGGEKKIKIEKDSLETGNEEIQPDNNEVGNGNTEMTVGNDVGNQPEGAKEEHCEDNKANDETEPQEKPVDEENGTDAAPDSTQVKESGLQQEIPETSEAVVEAELLPDPGDITSAGSTLDEVDFTSDL